MAGGLYERLGAKRIVTAGAVGLCAGGVLISLVGRDSGLGALIPGMLVLGVGTGLFYSSVTTAGVTALDPSRAGLAGGIVYMFQVAGGSIGLGLTTAIFTTASQDRLKSDALGARLDDAQTEAVDGVLAGTESAGRVIGELRQGSRRPPGGAGARGLRVRAAVGLSLRRRPGAGRSGRLGLVVGGRVARQR